MKIGILYICTGNYKVFWKEFYLSCEKNFITESERHYFVFTDSPEIEFEKENPRIHRIYQKNLGWPDSTLRRFDMFLGIEKDLKDFDYLFFFNADLLILNKITADNFLPKTNENLVAVLHPGYFNKKRAKFSYEKNKKSTAFIDPNSGKYYFAGGLMGGRTKYFLSASKEIKKNIDLDIKNNLLAIWHDESHWNKYLETYKNIKILDPGYLYPEAAKISFKKMIMIRDKRKYFSYQEMGKSNADSSKIILKKIKAILRKKGFIQRTLIWQLIRKWMYRVGLLRTIYRNDKYNAVKNYIKNDIEYIKIKKEIDSFKCGNIYNFNGVRLPLLVITSDIFLNVLKPAVNNLVYDTREIEQFYDEQKHKYKTLTYLKDNYLEREPDYIGGHLVSHGFTYFFKEININKGDVVFDLGAAPGDFSATCIKMGASVVYAFDPEENNSYNLKKVSDLNNNKIVIVKKFCSAETNLNNNEISLDDFMKINTLNKIDFIKADIEGAEAGVLIGAKNILKKYQPKLAFCTYHSVNDENNIKNAIINANPNYKIYTKNGVIYAF